MAVRNGALTTFALPALGIAVLTYMRIDRLEKGLKALEMNQ